MTAGAINRDAAIWALSICERFVSESCREQCDANWGHRKESFAKDGETNIELTAVCVATGTNEVVEVVVVRVVATVVDTVIVVTGAAAVTVAMMGVSWERSDGMTRRNRCLLGVAPMQEQALEYAAAEEQGDA